MTVLGRQWEQESIPVPASAFTAPMGDPLVTGENRHLRRRDSGYTVYDAHRLRDPHPEYEQGVLFPDQDDLPQDYADSAYGGRHHLPAASEEASRRLGRPVGVTLRSMVDPKGLHHELSVHELEPDDPRLVISRRASLLWGAGTGEIESVHAWDEGHGLASLLLDSAHRMAETTRGMPFPQHSPVRSAQGVAWSRKQMARRGEETW